MRIRGQINFKEKTRHIKSAFKKRCNLGILSRTSILFCSGEKSLTVANSQLFKKETFENQTVIVKPIKRSRTSGTAAFYKKRRNMLDIHEVHAHE